MAKNGNLYRIGCRCLKKNYKKLTITGANKKITFIIVLLNQPKNQKTMKASELKINDTIRRDGYKFTVKEIIHETYKNGTPSLLICCTMGDSDVVDSFFHIKPTTKVK